jgi:hypothetical protein
MKNKFLGLAAIVVALGMSAFTVPASKATNKFTSYKWFKIAPGFAINSQVPAVDAVMYLGSGTTSPTDADCDNTNVNQCISGFLPSQVNSSNQLINDHQSPAVDAQTQTRSAN